MTVLSDPAYTVPPPGPPGPIGTMTWLRATVCRFAEGATHARRRALVEAMLRPLDPSDLRAAASSSGQTFEYVPVAVLAETTGAARRDVAEVVGAVRAVAAAYHPGTDAPGADAALARLLALLPSAEPQAAAQHVALLVQA